MSWWREMNLWKWFHHGFSLLYILFFLISKLTHLMPADALRSSWAFCPTSGWALSENGVIVYKYGHVESCSWFFTKFSDYPTYISCNVVDIHTHHHERSMTWVATSEIDGCWTRYGRCLLHPWQLCHCRPKCCRWQKQLKGLHHGVEIRGLWAL